MFERAHSRPGADDPALSASPARAAPLGVANVRAPSFAIFVAPHLSGLSARVPGASCQHESSSACWRR